MSDEDDKFRNIAEGFGQMEATMGTEAYQSQVEVNKAQAEMGRAQARMVDAQAHNVELSNTGLLKQLEGQEAHDTVHATHLLARSQLIESLAVLLRVTVLLLFCYGMVGLILLIRAAVS